MPFLKREEDLSFSFLPDVDKLGKKLFWRVLYKKTSRSPLPATPARPINWNFFTPLRFFPFKSQLQFFLEFFTKWQRQMTNKVESKLVTTPVTWQSKHPTTLLTTAATAERPLFKTLSTGPTCPPLTHPGQVPVKGSAWPKRPPSPRWLAKGSALKRPLATAPTRSGN